MFNNIALRLTESKPLRHIVLLPRSKSVMILDLSLEEQLHSFRSRLEVSVLPVGKTVLLPSVSSPLPLSGCTRPKRLVQLPEGLDLISSTSSRNSFALLVATSHLNKISSSMNSFVIYLNDFRSMPSPGFCFVLNVTMASFSKIG